MNPTQKKSSLFSLLVLALVIVSNAQTKAINKFYLQGGLGFSTHSGDYAEVGLQSIIKNKWSATLSYQSVNMRPSLQTTSRRQAIYCSYLTPMRSKMR